MAEESRRQRGDEGPLASLWRSDISRRLAGLVGLAVIVGVVVAVLFAAGLLGRQGGGTTQSGVPIADALLLEPPPPPGLTDYEVGTKAGQLAPDFEVSRIEDGSRVRLSDFRGRPVLINFWATWCPFCLFEMPDMQELLNRHPELAIIIIGRPEPVEKQREYLARIDRLDGGKGVSFTVNAQDPADVVIAKYDPFYAIDPNLMPISVFVDANGFVSVVQIGPWRLPQQEEALAKTLAAAR